MNRPVLLLNSSEEILTVISWKKAISLLFSQKATVPYNYNDFYEIKTPKNIYSLPTAIILNEYVFRPHETAKLTRTNLFRRDNYTCQYCNKHLSKENRTMDHIIPRSKGGKHTWKNTVTCCRKCNAKKGSKSLSESNMVLIKEPFVPTNYNLIFSIVENIKEPWNRWFKSKEINHGNV